MKYIDSSKYHNMKIGDILCKEFNIDGFFYSNDHIVVCLSALSTINRNGLIYLLDSIIVDETCNAPDDVIGIGNIMANANKTLESTNSEIRSIDTKYWKILKGVFQGCR